MQDQSWFNGVALITVASVLVLGAGLFVAVGSHSSVPTSVGPSSLPEVDRTLTIALNPITGTYDFSASYLQVPAHVRVVLTIVNFDTSIGALAVPWADRVVGTAGGTEQIVQGESSVTVDHLPAWDVSHTFTMFHAFYNVSVPIPPAPSAGDPSRVTVTLVLQTTGTFAWGCVAYCGTMSPMEKMAGTIQITS